MIKAKMMFRAIECKFIGPTNFRGQRIAVRWADKAGARKVYHWNYELSCEENYQEAAKRFYAQIADVRQGEGLDKRTVRLEGGGTDRGAVFVIR